MHRPASGIRHGTTRLASAALGAFCYLLLTPLGNAQDPALEQAPQLAQTGPGLSEVELIVFRYLDLRGNTPEVSQGQPDPASDPMGESPPAGFGSIPTGTAYAALPASALQLGSVAARLRRPDRYELLYHGGWIQPVQSRRNATLTALPQEAAGSGLQGGLTLYQRRFLHATVDLQLAGNTGSQELLRIRQERRMRGSALHYFDNPGFGVILAVRPRAMETAAETR